MNEVPGESREELLKFLEEVSGRKLRTREDVRRYLEEIAAKARDENLAVRFWQTVKQATWLFMVIFAFLQYYYMDVLSEIASIRQVTFPMPPKPPYIKS